jgi:undecaprenyl phosphate-alpha-L-ara4N flippase subunit ArnE
MIYFRYEVGTPIKRACVKTICRHLGNPAKRSAKIVTVLPTGKMMENMRLINVILTLAVTVALSGGQILFKLGATRSSIYEFNFMQFINGYTILALVLYGGATLLWMYVLRSAPLNSAYPLVALSFVFVPIVAHFVLGEAYSLKILMGGLVIVAGVYLANS